MMRVVMIMMVILMVIMMVILMMVIMMVNIFEICRDERRMRRRRCNGQPAVLPLKSHR